MLVSRVSSSTFDVFNTFYECKVPPVLTIESKDGDYSLLHELPERGFAIVGTRYPQHRSLALLDEAFQDLKSSKLIIISGFARGIDARAHELAVTSGLRTIAILGCGIDVTYPKENQKLRTQILQSGGLILTQFENGAKPLAYHFHERNSLIAGLSKATWVVEAAEVSGTLNTATWAMKLNRDVYATSCFPKDHYYQGNVKLPERFPFAHAYFHVDSLSATWPELAHEGLKKQMALSLPIKPRSKIQHWVLELLSLSGECHVQTLLNHASNHGITPGQFYKLYETEIDSGSLVQDRQGRVVFAFTQQSEI